MNEGIKKVRAITTLASSARTNSLYGYIFYIFILPQIGDNMMDLEDVLGEIIEVKALAFAGNEMLDSLNQTAADYQNNCTSAKLTATELVRVSEGTATLGWMILERIKTIETQLGALTDQDAQNN